MTTPTTTTTNKPIHYNILPDLCHYVFDRKERAVFNRKTTEEKISILIDVQIKFDSFPAGLSLTEKIELARSAAKSYLGVSK